MDNDAECKDSVKVPLFKDWKFWIAVLSLACTIVSTVIAIDRHIDAKNEAAARFKAEESAETARTAEKSAEKRVEQLEAEQDSMRRFLINYSAHLTEIRNSLSSLKELRTVEAENKFWASVDAFITFVERWRRVQPILRELLDGVVDKLAAAALAKDKVSVHRLSMQLGMTLSDQRLLMEKEIENLKRSAP